MTTASLITFLARQFPDWSRMALLDFIADVQEEVLAVPTEYMRVIDDKYGTNYQLPTDNGKLSYALDEIVDPHKDYFGGAGTFEPLQTSLGDGVYHGVTQSATDGLGTGALFDITIKSHKVTVEVVTIGSLYQRGDSVVIDSSDVGGTSPLESLLLIVDNIDNEDALTYPMIMIAGKVTGSEGKYEIYNHTLENGNPVARARQGSKDQPAVVQFQSNPGDTTTGDGCKYYIQAYRAPDPLETELDQITLPATYHIELAHGVAALIQRMVNGSSAEWDKFKGDTMIRIRYGLNNEGHGATYVPSRGV